MNWSLKLVKVKGIDIKVHLTFVWILIWAGYRWGVNTGDGMQGAIFGIVAMLLLFLSVTLHELGHRFQARKYGVKVRDITNAEGDLSGLLTTDDINEAYRLMAISPKLTMEAR